jgi:hypothetical protein
MIEIIDLLMSLSQEVKDIKARLEVFKHNGAEKLTDTWLDSQDVMQALHISKRTLQTFRTNGVIPFSKIQGKFYYKKADIAQVLQDNYYNHNFKNNGNK